jgi:hypothetical protein
LVLLQCPSISPVTGGARPSPDEELLGGLIVYGSGAHPAALPQRSAPHQARFPHTSIRRLSQSR